MHDIPLDQTPGRSDSFGCPASVSQGSRLARIVAAVERAATLLPPQGPIGTFVAQNPLRGFEDRPFEEAVVIASRLHGAQAFLPESRYREALSSGRIRVDDLEAVLQRHLGDSAATPLCGGRTTLGALLRTMLLHPLAHETDEAVRWNLTEHEPFASESSAELWRACVEAVSGAAWIWQGPRAAPQESGRFDQALPRGNAFLPHADRPHRPASYRAAGQRPPVRHRDLIRAVRPALDTDRLVHPLLVRLVAAFVDQGVAAWPMPGRERGLLGAAAAVGSRRSSPAEAWSRPMASRLAAIARRIEESEDARGIAAAVAVDELVALGIPETEWEEHVLESLVAIRGWAGLIHQLELRPDRAPVEAVPARLLDLLALRLVLDRAATEWAARLLESDGHVRGGPRIPPRGGGTCLSGLWTELRDRHPAGGLAGREAQGRHGTVARAFLFHQLFERLGLTAADVRAHNENDILSLEQAILGFDTVSRRRLFHLAYERRYRRQILDAVTVRAGYGPLLPRGRSGLQAVFCIDDRCESFRRHLEEARPDAETFGAAGFFSVAMVYRGLDDWHATPLCPLPMRPAHTVHEVPEEGADALHRHLRRQKVRRRIGRAREAAASGSRTLLLGGVLTSLGGAIAAVPLVAGVLFPRLAALAADRAVRLARPEVPGRLRLRCTDETPLADGTSAGFRIDEMAAIVRTLLEDIGLARTGVAGAAGSRGLARLVVLVGHGSTSLNNPHESAYDCGACGGGRGGPNARAFAMMANDPLVRRRLAAAGLEIPDDTRFVGGMLDTCTSRVTWYDTASLPDTHADEFAACQESFGEAGQRDAHERCRRFESVPLEVSAAEALCRVQARSCDLAQVRPEYGHAGTAICIVGRRSRTRGLFLDRRSFLMSYDPDQDADGRILGRILAAVGPVCGGISLAYLFSTVDPTVYGAGTKLPHNVTGLVGVMDGHAGDLRTGLPLQGVEIHEPMRLLMIVEAPIERIARAIDRLPAVKGLVGNRWIQLAAWDPASSSLAVHDGRGTHGFSPYRPDGEPLPHVATSAAWYAGSRRHLPPALVGDLP
jgi:uncharacterized protein YbcC (UPF0753/DUF2309 family)